MQQIKQSNSMANRITCKYNQKNSKVVFRLFGSVFMTLSIHIMKQPKDSKIIVIEANKDQKSCSCVNDVNKLNIAKKFKRLKSG